MEPIRVCRTCLVGDVKLYPMSESSLVLQAFIKITGCIYFENVDLICVECALLIKRYHEFRMTVVHVDDMLSEFLETRGQITMDMIRSIDRKALKLGSRLSFSQTETINIYPENSADYDYSLYNSDDVDDLKIDLGETKKENAELVFSQDLQISIPFSPDIIEDQDIKDQDIKDQDIKDQDINLIVKNENAELGFSQDLQTSKHFSSDIIGDQDINLIANIIDSEVSDELLNENKVNIRNVTKRKRRLESSNISMNKKAKAKRSISVKYKDNIVVKGQPKRSKRKENRKSVGTKKVGRRAYADDNFFDGFVSITKLTPDQVIEEMLQRKESRNYKHSKFKCDLCYKGFGSRCTFDNHMKKHKPENGAHVCVYCRVRFTKVKFLQRHVQGCHECKYTCDICSYTCFSKTQAKNHVNLHKGVKYPCSECSEIFSMPNTLLSHTRIKHATECVCDLCGSTYKNERGLRLHKNMLHKQETNTRRGPTCETCDVQFSTNTAWKRHLVVSSKHSVSNGCETCGETFEDAESLKRHTRSHVYPWTGRNTATSVHVCEVCGKTFPKSFFLAVHQRTHTGERPFACKECGKAFRSAQALNFHQDKHNAKARHRCQICSKAFCFRGSLYRHVRVSHLGRRLHKCSICDKSFPSPCDVRAHVQHVHDKVPWPKRNTSSTRQRAVN